MTRRGTEPDGSVGLWLGLAALSAALIAAGGVMLAATDGAVQIVGVVLGSLGVVLTAVFGYLAFAAHYRRWPFRQPPPAQPFVFWLGNTPDD